MILRGKPLKRLFKKYPLAARDFLVWFRRENARSKYSRNMARPLVDMPAHFVFGMVLEWMHSNDMLHEVIINADGTYAAVIYRRRPVGPLRRMVGVKAVSGIERLPVIVMRMGFSQVERILNQEMNRTPRFPVGIPVGLDVERSIFEAARALQERKDGEERALLG